jgi:hypothetical protein
MVMLSMNNDMAKYDLAVTLIKLIHVKGAKKYEEYKITKAVAMLAKK